MRFESADDLRGERLRMLDRVLFDGKDGKRYVYEVHSDGEDHYYLGRHNGSFSNSEILYQAFGDVDDYGVLLYGERTGGDWPVTPNTGDAGLVQLKSAVMKVYSALEKFSIICDARLLTGISPSSQRSTIYCDDVVLDAAIRRIVSVNADKRLIPPTKEQHSNAVLRSAVEEDERGSLMFMFFDEDNYLCVIEEGCYSDAIRNERAKSIVKRYIADAGLTKIPVARRVNYGATFVARKAVIENMGEAVRNLIAAIAEGNVRNITPELIIQEVDGIREARRQRRNVFVTDAEIPQLLHAKHGEKIAEITRAPPGIDRVLWRVRTTPLSVTLFKDGHKYPIGRYEIRIIRNQLPGLPNAVKVEFERLDGKMFLRRRIERDSDSDEPSGEDEDEYEEISMMGAYYHENHSSPKGNPVALASVRHSTICFGSFAEAATRAMRIGDCFTLLDASLTILNQPAYEASNPMFDWKSVIKASDEKTRFCSVCEVPLLDCRCKLCDKGKGHKYAGGCPRCSSCLKHCECRVKMQPSRGVPATVLSQFETM